MITEIKIKNSSGIYEEVILDLLKGKYDYRNQFIYNDTIINPAVLYGRNGSGKTSVLKTISNIIQIFSGDLQSGEYYAMNHEFSDDVVTEITLKFTLEAKDYEYNVKIEDKDCIIYEKLTSNDIILIERNKWQMSFSGLKEDESRDGLESFLNPMEINSKLSVVRYVGLNNLNDEVSDIYRDFKTFKFVGTTKSISEIGETESSGRRLTRYNDEYDKFLAKYPHIMKLKFRVDKLASGERIIALYKKDGIDYELDFLTQISSGTKDLYKMLSTLLSLEQGSLIVIDELEKTFHPELLDALIKDIVTNLDIQIICSSHNTHLLQSLRPDQIYFTKKVNDMTHLSRLSTDNPGIREIHNIEKLYLGGRIG